MTRTGHPVTVAVTAWLLASVALSSVGACTSSAPEDAPAVDEAPTVVSVTVTPIVSATLHGYIDGWGTVEPEPAGNGRPPASATIATPIAGLVSAITCQEGQRVTRGTVLFRLDSRVADIAVAHGQQAVAFAQRLVARQEQLGPGEATSQRAYQEAQQQLASAQSALASAELQRKLLDITAPIDGTIVGLHAKLGDAVDPATALADVIDLTRLVVNVSVRSLDVRQIKVGQIAHVSVGTAPGRTPAVTAESAADTAVSARVSFIGSQVDADTDTVRIRVPVPTRSGLRPGQFVTVRIAADDRPDRLAVPVESLLQGPDGPEIALVEGDIATRTRVTPGLREGNLVEVTGDGLRAGMSVVVRGAYGLPPTSRVVVVSR